MALDWKKVALFGIVVGAFVALGATHVLSQAVIDKGALAIFGWFAGWMTPQPYSKDPIIPPEVKS